MAPSSMPRLYADADERIDEAEEATELDEECSPVRCDEALDGGSEERHDSRSVVATEPRVAGSKGCCCCRSAAE